MSSLAEFIKLFRLDEFKRRLDNPGGKIYQIYRGHTDMLTENSKIDQVWTLIKFLRDYGYYVS